MGFATRHASAHVPCFVGRTETQQEGAAGYILPAPSGLDGPLAMTSFAVR